MSGLPPAEIREKARKVLESMRGIYSVWGLDITGFRRVNNNFVIIGSFSENMFVTVRVNFEITIDKDGNVIEAKMNK